jgi:CRP-like cAMP-binding protein
MSIHSLQSVLAAHPFFAGLRPEHMAIITGCAKNVQFKAGETVFREGQPADWFYLLREGRVALDVVAPPRGRITVQTLEAGEVLGWSWLFPPYKWHFGATCLEATRAVAMDGVCLRGKCDADPALGYELMKRFARVMMERLQTARVQLLDVYGQAGHG